MAGRTFKTISPNINSWSPHINATPRVAPPVLEFPPFPLLSVKFVLYGFGKKISNPD
jgi:hypothetical protein